MTAALAPSQWGARAADRFGAVGGSLLVGAVGVLIAGLVGLVCGVVARASQHAIDEPFHGWVERHTGPGLITRNMQKLSILGDVPMTQVLGALGAVILAVIFGRRWWLPVVVVAYGYFAERCLQSWLAHVIDRGAPPGQVGTFPSGGVGRPLAVYGAVLACSLLLLPAARAHLRGWAQIGLVALALAVGVSRVWLGKHWLSDVVTAVPFGLTLFAAVTALAACLETNRRR